MATCDSCGSSSSRCSFESSDPAARAGDRRARAAVTRADWAGRCCENLARWDAAEVADALDAVGVPVLAIQSTTMDTARERVSLTAGLSSPWIDLVRAHVPGAAVEILPGTSHFPQIERADDVNAALQGSR